MKLLAIDTSSNACSVALQIGSEISSKHIVEPRAHTRILLPMIIDILRDAGIELTDLNALVLGNGPGSFIGMRIGAAVAQGLAYGAGLNIVPVSSLAAVAAEAIAEHGAKRVLVAQDARMSEIYLGNFRAGADGLPESIVSEFICKAGVLPDLSGRFLAVGGGWQKYPELLTSNDTFLQVLEGLEYPRALHLLALGKKALANGQSVLPADLVPAYLRMKVADVPKNSLRNL